MLTVFRNAMPRVDAPTHYRRSGWAMRWVWWMPLLVLWLSACAPPPQVRPPTELMAVSVGPEDDLDELARRHLGSPSRKWIIKDFNQIDDVTVGQLVLIPRRNYRPGGLAPDGYQVVPVLAYPDLAAVKSEQASRIADRFRQQMEFIQTQGYNVVDIHQLIAFMNFKATLPPRAVVLTFDDQSRLFYDLIFPVLKSYQFTGTLFVSPATVGEESMVKWSQLREMMASGLRIQCRFLKADAAQLKPSPFPKRSRLAAVVSALAADRIRIETILSQPCPYLAYPDGQVAALMALLAEKAGYQAGFNLVGGSNSFYRDVFAVRRTPVKWSEDLDQYRKHFEVFRKEALR